MVLLFLCAFVHRCILVLFVRSWQWNCFTMQIFFFYTNISLKRRIQIHRSLSVLVCVRNDIVLRFIQFYWFETLYKLRITSFSWAGRAWSIAIASAFDSCLRDCNSKRFAYWYFTAAKRWYQKLLRLRNTQIGFIYKKNRICSPEYVLQFMTKFISVTWKNWNRNWTNTTKTNLEISNWNPN